MELKVNSNFALNSANASTKVSKDFSKNEKDDVKVTSSKAGESSYVSDEEALAALDGAKSKDKENKISEKDSKLSKEFSKKLDKKFGNGFASKLEDVAANNGMKVRDLVGLIQSESGFDPYIENGYGYVGFFQINENYFPSYGTTKEEYLQMTPVEQLDIVNKRLEGLISNSAHGHKNLTGGDIYAMNFMPACVFDENGNYQQPDGQGGGIFKEVYFPEAKPEEILEGETPEQAARRLDKYGEGNLDINKDGYLSTGEMQKRIENKYQEIRNSL